MIDISVITVTWQRPQMLIHCLSQFSQQELGDIRAEHIVISDGEDPLAERLASEFGAVYQQQPHRGMRGVHCKNDGINLARGEYVCFWDDDNVYYPHAISSLLRAAKDHDIGLVRTKNVRRKVWKDGDDWKTQLYPHLDGRAFNIIPESWSGSFVECQVDTMCVCVRRSVALQEEWLTDTYACDHSWLTRLHQKGATVSFSPVVIGIHV